MCVSELKFNKWNDQILKFSLKVYHFKKFLRASILAVFFSAAVVVDYLNKLHFCFLKKGVLQHAPWLKLQLYMFTSKITTHHCKRLHSRFVRIKCFFFSYIANSMFLGKIYSFQFCCCWVKCAYVDQNIQTHRIKWIRSNNLKKSHLSQKKAA